MGITYDGYHGLSYDWNGNYDTGPVSELPAPSRITLLRAPIKDADAAQAELRARWPQAVPVESELRFGGIAGAYDSGESYDSWESYDEATAGIRAEQILFRGKWAGSNPFEHITRAPFNAAAAKSNDIRALWSAVVPREQVVRLRAAIAAANAEFFRSPWAGTSPRNELVRLPWGSASAKFTDIRFPWSGTSAFNAFTRLRWAPGAWYRSGYTIPFDGEPDPPPGAAIDIPSFESLYMNPQLSILRVSDSADLDAIDCSVSLDITSFAWTFQASIPYGKLPLVNPRTRPSPEPITITINGYPGAFIVEGYSDQRRMGARTAKITGRSVSAYLAAPYSPLATFTNSSALTASQLATNLMPSGWTLIWSAQDWLVPENLFTYANLSPMAALAQLVNAIGAVILPDLDTQTLTVLPTYQLGPWKWGATSPAGTVSTVWAASHTYAVNAAVTPNPANGFTYSAISVTGPSSSTQPTWPVDGASTVVDGGITWQMIAPVYATVPSSLPTSLEGTWDGFFKNTYNGVFVSGQNSGVVGKVKLTGTAGDVLLPTATDALIVTVDAAVARGIYELGKASRLSTESVRALLLPGPAGPGNPGIFLPGWLLQMQDMDGSLWLALMMAVQIDASATSVRQTLTLARHQ